MATPTIEIFGGDGDDDLSGEHPLEAFYVLYGGAGDDRLTTYDLGGPAYGGDGNDTLVSHADYGGSVFGEAGDDYFEMWRSVNAFGGDGNDVFVKKVGVLNYAVGGDGLDVFLAEGESEDFIVEPDSISRAYALSRTHAVLIGIEIVRFDDRDVLLSDLFPAQVVRSTDLEGRSTFSASGAMATIQGTPQADYITASAADNTDTRIHAGAGDDEIVLPAYAQHRIHAGAGDDRIDATSYDSRIDAGSGDDWIKGGSGWNTIDGGSGQDVVDYSLGEANTSDGFLIEIHAPGQATVTRKRLSYESHSSARDEVANVETLRFADREIQLFGAPVTDAERFETTEGDPPLLIEAAELLDGDFDPLGGAPNLLRVENARGGEVLLTEAGDVEFAPRPGFHGEASFDYVVEGLGGESVQRVEVEVASSNRAPVANDDVFDGAGLLRVTGWLLDDNGAGADTDPDGDPLRVADVDGVALPQDGMVRVALDHGVIAKVHGDGSIVWNLKRLEGLAPGETDAVSFSYVTLDPEGALDSAQASVQLTGRPDAVKGGPGDQRLAGGPDADRLFGGGGADALLGRRGDDLLRGGAGSDRLLGRQDDDVLRGGRGGDRLVGGDGDDRLKGGAGADLFVFRPGNGDDRILDFDPDHDRLTVRKLAPDEGLASLDEGRDLLLLGPDLTIRIVEGGADGDRPVSWDEGLLA